MELLEQIWSSLSLGRSNDKTVSYVPIPVHPQAAMVWNQMTQTPSLPMRLEPPPPPNPYHTPHPHTSALVSPPLPPPREISSGSTCQAKKCPSEPLQCVLPSTTSRSHFLVPRSQKNKYGIVGGRAQPVYHHVLKPQPAICRVRQALGQAQ